MRREDVLVPLFIAALYFTGAFVSLSVVLERTSAFRIALVVMIVSMLILAGLREGLKQSVSDRLVGLQLALGFSLLVFGLIWWTVRTVLEILELWPFTDK